MGRLWWSFERPIPEPLVPAERNKLLDGVPAMRDSHPRSLDPREVELWLAAQSTGSLSAKRHSG